MTYSNSYAEARQQLITAGLKDEAKDLQKKIVSLAINNDTISWDYGSWIVPKQRSSESFRGYKSRIASWAYGLISENLCDRMNDPEDEFPICGLADFGELR